MAYRNRLLPKEDRRNEYLEKLSRQNLAMRVLTIDEQKLLARTSDSRQLFQEPRPSDYESFNDMKSFWEELGEFSGYNEPWANVNPQVEGLLTPEEWDDITILLDNYESAFATWKTRDYHDYIQTLAAWEKYDEEYYHLTMDNRFDSEGFKYQKGQISSMQALGLVGTAIGFGSFGYSVVRLYERNWKAAVGGIAVGAVALSLVGWNMNKLRDTVPFMADGDFMDPKDVEKILDASRGKIVSVTFIKRTTGEERTLVGRIGKNYKPTGTDPLGGKAARRKRNLFTIYDMQKGGFRMVSMDSVLSIKAAGKRHHG